VAGALLLTACGPLVNFDPGDPADFVQQPQTSFVEAADGTLLAELHAEQDRRDVRLDEVAPVVADAVVAIEDRRFWEHRGVDGGAVVRAALANVEAGEITQGGSTITQQYVKNTITGPALTMERKMREAVAAWQLEERYSKEQILERYLNTVYFGKGAYGIRAASLRFFGSEPDELVLPQAALLAGVIQSPSAYDPWERPDSSIARRNRVLEAMVATEAITRDEADVAKDAPLHLAPLDEVRHLHPYIVEEVRREIRDDPHGLFGALGDTPDDRMTSLFTGGYRVVTTLDPDAQEIAEATVAEILPEDGGPSAAVVVTDPVSGAIRAMVGGRDYYDLDDPIARFNLATQGLRQPGSSFKPIVLAAALERGVSLDTIYPGGACVQFPSLPDQWAPCNYGGASYAPMTLREATVRSVNTVYARLGMEIGPSAVVDTARSMGIDGLNANPALVLGTNEVTVKDMAGAYGVFANRGRYTRPYLIERIETLGGEVVHRASRASEQVLGEANAYLVTQALTEAVTRGTGVRARIDRPQAGKTGTSQRNADAWFVGYTPDLVAAVWVGFPQSRVPMRPPNTPEVVEGGRWPAQIWQRIASQLLADVEPSEFPVPRLEMVLVQVDVSRACLPNPYTPPELISEREFLRGTEPTEICREPVGPPLEDVPAVTGLPIEVARRLLENAGFRVDERPLASRRFPPGIVELQRPGAGGSTRPADGNAVVLWVSTAITSRSQVPDVRDMTVADAVTLLEGAGWVPIIQRMCPPEGCTGQSSRIWGQSPAAATLERDHSIITLYVEPEDAPAATESPTPEPTSEPTSDPTEPAGDDDTSTEEPTESATD
jgi:penicillin-binding protein 1A